MNGAESLVRTLVAGGVDVCFANPGTSEMHFVAALDRVEGMRCVLGLFEGVVTGAADGYFRMTRQAGLDAAASRPRPRQRPRQPAQRQEGQFRHRQHRRPARHLPHRLQRAADLRHRGPGAADVGLGADLAGCEVRRRATAPPRSPRPASAPAQIATLILPADTAWNEADGIAQVPAEHASAPSYSPQAVDDAAQGAARRRADAAADDRQRADRARAGAGRADRRQDRLQGDGPDLQSADGARPRAAFAIDRIPYVIEQALPILKDFQHIVLVEANDPVAFFAYPNKPSLLKPEGCEVHRMTRAPREFGGGAGGAGRRARRQAAGCAAAGARSNWPSRRGALSHASIAQAIALAIPENAIVVDEIDHHRPRLLSADGGAPRRTTGCRTWAARSASRRRWRPAPRWPARTAR